LGLEPSYEPKPRLNALGGKDLNRRPQGLAPILQGKHQKFGRESPSPRTNLLWHLKRRRKHARAS